MLSAASLALMLLVASQGDAVSQSSIPQACPEGSDYTGDSLKAKHWLWANPPSEAPLSLPKIKRVFISQLDGKKRCPPGVYSSKKARSTITQKGHKYYELTNFCIQPMFLGGVTLHRPKQNSRDNLALEDGGLEVCTEIKCSVYPVTTSQRELPCHGVNWVSGASALVVPFTNGNPWHFLHHLLPLSQVLTENKESFRKGTVHLYTTLASRPNQSAVSSHRRASQRWHPFPARTYFSTWRFRWWPLLAAALPLGLRMIQVDHLELLKDDPEFADPGSCATVCYRHGFLGVPQLYDRDTTVHQEPLVPIQHIRAFRERALELAGVGDHRIPTRCRSLSLIGSGGKRPLMGLIVRKGTRKLCNLKGVAEAAAELGFLVELVQLEDMDVFGQIQAANRFDFFVGAHGAGMTNVFWMKPGAVVLEMYPALPNEPLREGEGVNGGSNYGRFAVCSSARHIVWVQRFERPTVKFRVLDVTMDLNRFKTVAESAYRTWKLLSCLE